MPARKPPPDAQPPKHASADDPSYVRLHITPFDPEFLKFVVPASTLPLARDISFHSIETFPENRYGFVELPTTEAEKLRKKFHGATLKGRKMKVEKARAKQEVPGTGEEVEETEQSGKKRKSKHSGDGEKSSKKHKRDRNVVEGVLLKEGRKVKRGWTIPDEQVKEEKKKNKDKKGTKSKKRQKSEYTDKEECLMKILPSPNAPVLEEADGKKKKTKKGKPARQVTVHEFEHTNRFPTFLKSTSDDVAATSKDEETLPKNDDKNDDTSSDSSSSEEEESSEDEKESPVVVAKTKKSKKNKERRTVNTELVDDASLPSSPTRPGSSRPKSSSSMRSLTIKIPPVTPAAEKVHPLEALYKKPKASDAPQETPAAEPFSFFGGGGDAGDADSDEGGEDSDAHADAEPSRSSQPPMTPFTKQEFEWRHVRSAAPTPDTAHPSKTRVFWAPEEGDDVEEEEEEDQEDDDEDESRTVDGDKNGEKETVASPLTDFKKHFYERRGELRRSWTNRLKAAKKEKRYRVNKARARKF